MDYHDSCQRQVKNWNWCGILHHSCHPNEERDKALVVIVKKVNHFIIILVTVPLLIFDPLRELLASACSVILCQNTGKHYMLTHKQDSKLGKQQNKHKTMSKQDQ